jgi:hypothetical protein
VLVKHGAFFQFGFNGGGIELVNAMPFFQSRLQERAEQVFGRWFRGVLGFVVTTMILRVGGGILSYCPPRRYGDEWNHPLV